MSDNLDFKLALSGAADEAAALARCNEISARFGLELTSVQLASLGEARREALKNTGRVELDGGVLPKLVYAFCDSPFIAKDEYFDTLVELQDLFYYFKNNSSDLLSDDDVVESMSAVFNTAAGGDLEFIAGLNADELVRLARGERYAEDEP